MFVYLQHQTRNKNNLQTRQIILFSQVGYRIKNFQLNFSTLAPYTINQKSD